MHSFNSSQLSHLSEALSQIIRVDPFTLFPREVCLRVLGYLDAISLGKAAQVSKQWKSLADDDLLWRRMCGQHIERKCTKCGWGLPLLERRRLRKELNLGAPDRMMVGFEHHDHGDMETDHAHAQGHEEIRPISPEAIAASGSKGHKMVSLPRSFTAHASSGGNGGALSTSAIGSINVQHNAEAGPSTLKRPCTDEASKHKRRRMDPSSSSQAEGSARPRPDFSSDSDAATRQDEYAVKELEERKKRKPWKHVYCERLIVERNWRKGRYTERTLKVSALIAGVDSY